MIIKKMESSHLAQVYDIEQKSFTHPWSCNAFESELKKPDSYSFVVLEADVVIAYIVVDYVIDEMYLMDIAVHPDYRRRGVARTLFQYVFDLALKKGMRFITLEVRESNQSAVALYTELGFNTVAIRKNYYSNPCDDALLMTKYF